MPAISILGVDIDERYWKSVQVELAGDPRFGTAVRAQDRDQALTIAASMKPTVAIVDITFPGPAALTLIQRLGEIQPPAAIVAVAESLDDGRVGFALGAGATACIARTAPPRLIAGAVLEVAAGGMPIQRELAGRPQLLTRLVMDYQRQLRGMNISHAPCPLTQRESTVLEMVSDGQANKEIGGALSISERTVKNHMTNILVKLHARDRAHAVRIGVQNSWIGNGGNWQRSDGLGVAA